jgi:hypothetical protein
MGYGGFGGQQYGGGFGGYGMGGYADPYGQMGGFGGYGDPYSQIGGMNYGTTFGGYNLGGGFGGFGGFGQQPILPPSQPTVNDLFSRYFSQQYYGGPAFDPFAATSLFGGGYGGGYGYGGGMQGGAGFGGGRGMRRGGRQRLQQGQNVYGGPATMPANPPVATVPNDQYRPKWMPEGYMGDQVTRPPPAVQTPAPAPAVQNQNTSADYWFDVLKQSNPDVDDARLRELAQSRAATFAAPAAAAPPPPPPAPAVQQGQDNWAVGQGFDASNIPQGFDWQAYVNAPGNADLIAAGIDTPIEAQRHYALYGRNENRQTGMPAQAQPIMQPAVQPQYEYALPYGSSSLLGAYSGLYSPFASSFRF